MQYSTQETATQIQFRPEYVFVGFFFAAASGSMMAYAIDRVDVGQSSGLILLIFLGYLISKGSEKLRHAMGLGNAAIINRPLPWCGDWEAWIISLGAGSFAFVKVLDRGSAGGMAALVGLGGALLLLVIIVSWSQVVRIIRRGEARRQVNRAHSPLKS
jgi:hypothetical protein